MAELNPEPDYGETSYRGSGRLSGQVALITEADSGIGRAVALAFAREGADVVLSCFDERAGGSAGGVAGAAGGSEGRGAGERAAAGAAEPSARTDTEESARWVLEAGRRAIISCGDVRSEGYRKKLIDETLTSFGRLDILVTNSAFQWSHSSQTGAADPLEMEREFRTQNESVFFLSKGVAPRMTGGGSIIHTMPIQSAHPTAQMRAYATTQMAIANFTASFARQWAQQNIRVNAVAPGPVWTKRIVSLLPPETIATFGRDTLRGRPAQPAEVAPLYVFLASNDARLISGAVVPIG